MDDASDVDSDLAQEIEEQVEEWSSNSNDVFNIALLGSDGEPGPAFHPMYTYPYFGEEEAIFGYQGLAINLTFRAYDMRPSIDLSWDAKFQTQGSIQATDIKAALSDYVPDYAWISVDGDGHGKAFKPPGDRVHAYSAAGESFEVWSANLDHEGAREILENVQVLVPMFIEGGSSVQFDEEEQQASRWKLHLLYRVSTETSPYALVGFGTSYRVFAFPDRRQPAEQDVKALQADKADAVPSEDWLKTNDFTGPLDLPSRERISQFLILEPFQKRGHGQELYNSMYTHLTSPGNVRELSVEDPNESFDELRDLADLRRLRTTVPAFANLRINTAIPASELASTSLLPIDLIVSGSERARIRQQTKIDARQFDRLVEMHTLSFIPPLNRSRNRITRKEKSTNEHDKAFFFWRLYVKYRLFIFNRDQLIQLEGDERISSLESTVDAVMAGYQEALERVEKADRAAGDGNVVAGASSRRAKKRPVIEDEDDEDEPVTNGGSGKKARIG